MVASKTMRKQLTGDFNQRKLARLVTIMEMLSSDSGASVDALMKATGVTQRSIYRYLNMFDSSGYTITKSYNKFKFTNLVLKLNKNGN
jgi:DeoR/GlpR family transcriptional regulator of sugar metabolism